MFISCSPAEKKRALFFEFRTIIPLENHCFGDRPFLPFEVGRARAIALISLAWLKLTTWFGCGSAVNEPIFAVLNQLANVNGLKGQLINLASTLTTNGAQSSSFSVFYDWINTKIKSITQLSKPLLKEQNNGSDLHHYKHMSTSHFLRNNTHKWFAKH